MGRRPVWYWLLKTLVIGPLGRIFWWPWAKGTENIPTTGPAILASNHLAVIDSIFLPLAVPRRRLTFPAKKEYFTGRGIKGRLTKAFMSGVGQVPIDRASGVAALSALNALENVLHEGGLVGYYPEGTRSPDGRLYRGKTGVARLVLATGAPVIPVVMVNTDKIQPIGRVFPKLRPRPGVIFGKPLDFSRYEGMSGDRFVERSMTDEIMYELMQLSGQEYVDVYAAKVKAELDRSRRSGPVAARAAASNVARRVDPESADRKPAEKAG
jgi:1-acyl-sn-glycerol-3-phosphate acyltransferase